MKKLILLTIALLLITSVIAFSQPTSQGGYQQTRTVKSWDWVNEHIYRGDDGWLADMQNGSKFDVWPHPDYFWQDIMCRYSSWLGVGNAKWEWDFDAHDGGIDKAIADSYAEGGTGVTRVDNHWYGVANIQARRLNFGTFFEGSTLSTDQVRYEIEFSLMPPPGYGTHYSIWTFNGEDTSTPWIFWDTEEIDATTVTEDDWYWYTYTNSKVTRKKLVYEVNGSKYDLGPNVYLDYAVVKEKKSFKNKTDEPGIHTEDYFKERYNRAHAEFISDDPNYKAPVAYSPPTLSNTGYGIVGVS